MLTDEPDVFLSYGRPDGEHAERLYRALTKRGVQVWWDRRSLLAGQEWKAIIQEAQSRSRAILAVLSSRTAARKGYLQKELRDAIDILEQSPPGSVCVIPVRLDPCEVKHKRLRDLQWADLFPDFEAGVADIMRTLEAEGIASSQAAPIHATGTEAAENLLTRLLEQQRVITYKQARRLLLGVPLSKPYSQADTARVLRAARTSPREFGGLTIQLDTLIVKSGRKRPGDGHFDERPYSSRGWQEVFGSWPLLEI